MGFKKVKKFILRITPKKVLNLYQEPIKNKHREIDIYSTLSYSQEGEDLILKRIFEGQKTGFYVDVGAHHPKRFSNTYLFYKLGWRGINIDAMPGSMKHFKEIRPNDINLEVAVSDKKEKLKYYMFNEPALNTFSKQEVEKKDGRGNYKVIDEVIIDTIPLSELLNKHLKDNEQIDFLNIDVEGLDLDVLHSIDWSIHQPKTILVEELNNQIEKIYGSEIFKFLKSKDYILIAKTFNTLIFLKKG
ncbi:FkbM family methyltransferase [Gillisia sp. Q332]|uniref:FkbM family methyltransferase n=1 Tax=Gillisia xinjiangensis TaxID=3384765 RepID=UPI00391A1F82